MEKITLFFCDIYGTIDNGCNELECKEFSSLLENLILVNNSDYLMFAMASTEEKNIIEEYEKKLSKYFERNVIMLPKLPDNKILDESKINFIISHIKNLLEKYEINEIYLADDSIFNQEILKELLFSLTGINLISIIPKENENHLKFINNSIKEIINDKIAKKVR